MVSIVKTSTKPEAKLFQRQVLKWFECHGRKNLPWQKAVNPYRVWVSEIMLQQTQVTTVIDYFERFLARFPDVYSLASAPIDEVLHLWSGLGYYARARNLHQCAKKIVVAYNGIFPTNLNELQTLPGIGRSTAGAILALSMQQSAAILDGNVKRVLARFHAINGWPGHSKVANQLWNLAEYYTPTEHCAAYTQAMMDLGATICTRTQPKCTACPLQINCLAYQQEQPTAYPESKPKRDLPIRATNFLLLCYKNSEILLVKRPPVGIWGGLWSFPECQVESEIQEFCKKNYQLTVNKYQKWPKIQHTFSHFQLNILPIISHINHKPNLIMETNEANWYKIDKISLIGLAAPVKRLLESLRKDLASLKLTKRK